MLASVKEQVIDRETGMITTQPNIQLDGYAAKKCARLTHNKFSPDAPEEPDVDAFTRHLMDQGNAFEDVINERLSYVPGALWLSDEDGWESNMAQTLDAMRRCVPLIVNGRLPNTETRSGAPDVLVFHDGGYLPVDIKCHSTRNDVGEKNVVRVSTFDAPADLFEAHGLSESTEYLYDDGLQLAHYTRMLQELGFHAGDDHPIGGIIGNSDFTDMGGNPWLIIWYDLTRPRKDTYSKSSDTGRAKRGLMKLYDHEFAFRLDVAREAKLGGQLVRPFHISDCKGCVWLDYCKREAGPDDVSFKIGTYLPTAQRWRMLSDQGVTTLDALADLDPALPPTGWGHRGGTAKAWADLVRRANMVRDGVPFEPKEDWPEVPTAEVEVDFDIEWDFDERIYLWGLRVRQGQDDDTADYQPVYDFGPLDDAGAARLASQFAERIRTLADDAEAQGKTFKIFHWSDPESTKTMKFADVAAALDGRLLDIGRWFEKRFFSADGWSIKVVAPALEFGWGVDDPGGAESQVKIEEARAGGPDGQAAAEWLLTYNRSDVAAQAAVRDGLARRHPAN